VHLKFDFFIAMMRKKESITSQMKGSCLSQAVLVKVEVALGPYLTVTQSPSSVAAQLRFRLRTERSKEHQDIFPGQSFCVPEVQ
jgi:hypothetical protein